MKVLKTAVTEGNVDIQIEDWSDNYSFMEYGATIGAYPISKQTGDKPFSPTKGDKMRLTYNFKDNSQTQKVFNKLITGEITLRDIEEYLHDRRYKDFI